MQEKALEEDPTIYQYDELYDDMAAQKDEAKKAKKTDVKEAKYIGRLLVTADKRKKEYERRVERQVQKERETEGDMYADKEIFVTATYRAKLEEMKKAEDEERREEYLESIGDVTKQRDLGGFYRHLYEQRMGADGKDDATDGVAAATAATKEAPSTSNQSPDKAAKTKKQRTYRRRQSKDNEDDDDNNDKETGAKTHLPSNLDADSDFSIDSSSDDEENESGDKIGQKDEKAGAEERKVVESKSDVPPPEHTFAVPNPVDDRDDTGSSSDEEPQPEVKEIIVKIDIWKKRTVGDVFDAALQRYYERKQLREAWF